MQIPIWDELKVDWISDIPNRLKTILLIIKNHMGLKKKDIPRIKKGVKYKTDTPPWLSPEIDRGIERIKATKIVIIVFNKGIIPAVAVGTLYCFKKYIALAIKAIFPGRYFPTNEIQLMAIDITNDIDVPKYFKS